jgi:hypothetical protein
MHSGASEGLFVRNDAGQTWHTRCDGQLFIRNGDEVPAVRQPVEAVAASVKEVFIAHLFGQTPDKVYAATTFIPFPHPDGPSLIEKFPADISAERIDALLDGVKWYIKVPYISTGLTAENIKALCVALPTLMEEFRLAVTQDVADPHTALVRRLPKTLIEGYTTIK